VKISTIEIENSFCVNIKKDFQCQVLTCTEHNEVSLGFSLANWPSLIPSPSHFCLSSQHLSPSLTHGVDLSVLCVIV
jgi:hypothetical protein